ncbi:MAG: hypothetical protein EBZ77_18170, partial [Chitinophagia bacterium]|nr:hypothetical protein [Chitinophagia bacterium]
CMPETTEIEGAETCTLCGLERARCFGPAALMTTRPVDGPMGPTGILVDGPTGPTGPMGPTGPTGILVDGPADIEEAKNQKGLDCNGNRRVEDYRRYVGSLALNESVASDAVRLYARLVVSRGLVFRGLRNVAVRLACVAAALDKTSAAVKHAAVVADTAECARYGYARLRRALDRALDSVLGTRACFVGASTFGVDVGGYQRAVAKLGCAHTLVRACARVDAECFTPSERARYKDENLQKAVLLSVAKGPYDTVGRARLGLNQRTASRVRRLIVERSSGSWRSVVEKRSSRTVVENGTKRHQK